MTKIEWTDLSWNPIVGCSVVSPGCTNCYAMRQAPRLGANPTTPQYAGTAEMTRGGPVWTGKVAMASDHVLTAPLRRRKPTTYFVNSMGDLFHENVPDDWIDRVFAVMALSPQHTFQILTKRADRMRGYMNSLQHEIQGGWPLGPRLRSAAENVVRNMRRTHFDCVTRWPSPTSGLESPPRIRPEPTNASRTCWPPRHR